MQYHTAPSRSKAVAKQLGAEEGSDDADAPHAGDVADEREHSFTHTLQHTFDDDGDAVEWLRDSHHAEHSSTEQDNFDILAEDADHVRCKQEQKTAGQNHESDLDGE